MDKMIKQHQASMQLPNESQVSRWLQQCMFQNVSDSKGFSMLFQFLFASDLNFSQIIQALRVFHECPLGHPLRGQQQDIGMLDDWPLSADEIRMTSVHSREFLVWKTGFFWMV